MKLIFATNNAHKLREMQQLAAGTSVEIVSLADIGCTDEIPETGDTLDENALQKARFVYGKYRTACFADDTGLEVDALGGAPGVHSARYAPGEGHDAAANMALLLANMEGKANREARFRTCMAFVEADGTEHTVEGIVEGEILTSPTGADGFGYDPVFRPDGFDKSFAEMSADEKNSISHRGRASRRLMELLSTIYADNFTVTQ